MTPPTSLQRRPLTWPVVAVTLTVAVAGLGLGEWAGWPFLRLPLAKQLSQMSGVQVVIEAPFRVQLLGSPRLTAAGLTVAAAEGTVAPHLLAATGVRLSLRWSDLWRAARGGGVRVRELAADSLDAQLLRSKEGRASWQLGVKPAAGPPEPVPSPVVERFSVRQATIKLDDQSLALRLDMQIAEFAKAGVAAGMSSRVTARGMYRQATVSAKAEVDDMLALFATPGDAKPSAQVDAQVAVGRATLVFKGGLGGLAKAPSLRGELTAKGPSLGLVMEPLGLTMPQTPPFLIHGDIGLAGPVWHLTADRIEVGSSRLGGNFAFDTQRQPPHLSGQLTGSLLVMKDLAPSVGAQVSVADRGRAFPDKPLDIPSLKAMDANIAVAIDALGFDSAAVMPMSRLRAELSLRDGHLRLENLSAQVAGGTVRGSTSLQSTGAKAHWQAALQFEKIALSQWIRALKAPAPTPGRPNPVPLASGQLNARISLDGHGRSVAEILGGANGQLQASVTGGTLSHLVTEAAGLDVAQALGVVLRGDRSLNLRCARVQAQVRNGVVSPVQGLVDNSDSALTLDGNLDLRSEALNLRLVSRPKDFSPLSLRSPVLVRGSLSQARFSVEAGPLAARILGALALGAAAPVLAWLPLLDAGDGDKSNPCTRAAGLPPAHSPAAGK